MNSELTKESSQENLPNAGRVIEALRHVGYENVAAIADIVDNSFDASASKVQISIVPDDTNFTLAIADNGSGMTLETLDEALKLGSETSRSQESDLGKFGMGLVTASLSISRKLTVITKSKKGGYYTSIQDIDEICRLNRFVKTLRESTADEIKTFNSYTNSNATGTVVIMSNCDQIQDTQIDRFSNTITKELGQIFRIFIAAGKAIHVGNKKVAAVDPLMLNNPETKLVSEEEFEVKTKNGVEKITVKLVILPETADANSLTINIHNQGFYVMRNYREIVGGVDLDVFSKHNRYNRFRGEIYFSGNLDSEMRVEFTKRDIKPKKDIFDRIYQIAIHQLRSIEKEIGRLKIESKETKEVHGKSAKVITEKSNLLIKPEIEVMIEKREKGVGGSGTVESADTGRTRTPSNIQRVVADKFDVRYKVMPMGQAGVLFDSDNYGKVIEITYNSDHPFYQKIFIENNNNQELKNYVDYVIYSMVSAKMVVFDEKKIDLIDDYMGIFSNNLRTLMK